ncbi:MAG: hypothetical protein JWO37_12 [Acidimicrobiales bacterium]|nr:hypothetical protein [Acidimicrobiales bacterium]
MNILENNGAGADDDAVAYPDAAGYHGMRVNRDVIADRRLSRAVPVVGCG